MMPTGEPGPAPRERGYALVAAVAGIGLFAAVALDLVTATRIAVTTGAAEIARAKAEAAAAAGLAIAQHDLAAGGEEAVRLADGRIREVDLGDCRIAISAEDERGKVPVNLLEDAQFDRLLRGAGLEGTQLEIARDSLQDWLDEDDEARPNGAEAAWYSAQVIAPRNGPLRSVGELARIRGFTPALAARLAGYVTVTDDVSPFDPGHARPEAIAVMNEGGQESPQALIRAREAVGQRTAFVFGAAASLVGRPFTIVADAVAPGGGHVRRTLLVVIQNSADHPIAVRAVE